MEKRRYGGYAYKINGSYRAKADGSIVLTICLRTPADAIEDRRLKAESKKELVSKVLVFVQNLVD